MTAATPLMLRMQSVDKHFGPLHVLRDINLEVDTGQVVVVLGPSGSGKSTLLRTLNHLEKVDRGLIQVDGQPVGYRLKGNSGGTSYTSPFGTPQSHTRPPKFHRFGLFLEGRVIENLRSKTRFWTVVVRALSETALGKRGSPLPNSWFVAA